MKGGSKLRVQPDWKAKTSINVGRAGPSRGPLASLLPAGSSELPLATLSTEAGSENYPQVAQSSSDASESTSSAAQSSSVMQSSSATQSSSGASQSTSGAAQSSSAMQSSITGPSQVSVMTLGSGNFSVAEPRYAGVGSFQRFSSDLDAFCALNGFNDDQKLRFLPLCLSGVARDAFESIPPESRQTFGQTVAALQGLFHKPSALDAHGKLRNLRYDPQQPLGNFVIHLRRPISEAFPGNTSDVVLFNSFLSALPRTRDILSH